MTPLPFSTNVSARYFNLTVSKNWDKFVARVFHFGNKDDIIKGTKTPSAMRQHPRALKLIRSFSMSDSNVIPLAQQEWRPVVGLEDLYEVSEYGFVRRLKPGKNRLAGHLLSLNKDTCGYYRVHMWNTYEQRRVMFSVHRLVMLVFVGHSDLEVNHIDGNRTNNHISNLEYVTHRENILHAFKYLDRIKTVARGEDASRAKLTKEKVIEIRKRAAAGETRRAIAADYGVSHVAITQIVLRRTWTHVEEEAS